MCTAFEVTSAQYIYWEHTIGGLDSEKETYTNIIVEDESIVAYGSKVFSLGAQARRYDFEGYTLDEDTIPYPILAQVLSPSAKTFQKLPNNEGYIAIGYNYSEGNSFVVHINNSLDTLGCNIYSIFNDGSTAFNNLMITEENTIIIVGFVYPYANEYEEYTFMLEMDLEGDILWTKVLNQEDGYRQRSHSFEKVEDGYLMAVDWQDLSDNFEDNTLKGIINKVDFEGNIMWQAETEGSDFGWGNRSFQLVKKSNGEIFILYIEPYENFYYDFDYPVHWSHIVMASVNDNGNIGTIEIQQEYLNSHEIHAARIIKVLEHHDGGLLVLGSTAIPIVDYNHTAIPWLMKIDTEGNQEWYYEYPMNDSDPEGLDYYVIQYFNDIEPTPDGGYAMAGLIQKLWNGDTRSRLLKIDGCGDVEWDGCEPLSVGESYMPNIGLTLWPQPVTDALQLQWKTNIEASEIRIITITGSEAKREYLTRNTLNQSTINIGSLSNGLYVVQLRDKKGVLIGSEKMMVER